jgi:hypothetical protein
MAVMTKDTPIKTFLMFMVVVFKSIHFNLTIIIDVYNSYWRLVVAVICSLPRILTEWCYILKFVSTKLHVKPMSTFIYALVLV